MNKIIAPVDSDRVALVGFTEVYAPEDPVFDIVLIHSFGGDSRTTWTGPDKLKKYTYDDKGRQTKVYIDTDVYWPSELLPEFNPKARVLVFGYSNDVSSFCGTESDSPYFLGIARELVKGLLELRRYSPLRPLHFVGHSLGGYLIKETIRLCRSESSTAKSVLSLESIPQATVSILFLCCPHADSINVSLPDAVETVLLSSGSDHARSLSDNFRANIATIKELHTDFLSFLEYRAPLVKVLSVQESSNYWNGHNKITEPTMLEDAALTLKHRYEIFQTAGVRWDQIPKLQFIRAWNVREAYWAFDRVVKSKWPESLTPSIRSFFPFRPNHALIGREVEMASILTALTSRGELCSRVGVLGTTGSGKTRIALGLSQILQSISSGDEKSNRRKSVFHIQANTYANIEADFMRLATIVGLPSDDLLMHIKDWLKSKYSGNWILIFDDVDDKSVFLDTLTRTNALPHTPTRSRLLDMIPRKRDCGVLFLSDDKACLREILDQSHDEIIEISPLSLAANVKILENQVQPAHDTNTSTLESTTYSTKLAELFTCNPVAIIQAAQLIELRHTTMESLQHEASTLSSPKGLMSLPTRLAVLKIKSTHPDCLNLLASLAALDINRIAKWLIADFTPNFTPQRLETLQSLALVNIKHNEDENNYQSFVVMHSLVRAAIIASFSASEWAEHVRRTITRMCHSFMLLSSKTALDFYTSAKSLATQLNAIRGDKDSAGYVRQELDTFARFFQGDWSPAELSQEVQMVFKAVAGGDLSVLFSMIHYVNNRRHTGPHTRGSQPIYWYVGKAGQAQRFRSRYMYD